MSLGLVGGNTILLQRERQHERYPSEQGGKGEGGYYGTGNLLKLHGQIGEVVDGQAGSRLARTAY